MREFEHAPSPWWQTALVALVVSFPAVIFLHDPRQVSAASGIAGLFFILVALWVLYRGWSAKTTVIQLTEHEVIVLEAGSEIARVRWESVAAIREQSHALSLYGPRGEVLLSVPFNFTRFQELGKEILARTPNRVREHGVPASFERTGTRAALVVMTYFPLLAIAGAVIGQSILLYLGLGAGVLIALMLLDAPTHVRVQNSELVLEGRLRTRTLPFDAISQVELSLFDSQSGTPTSRVVVHRTRGGPLQIGAIQAGSLALYEVLHSAWSRHHAA